MATPPGALYRLHELAFRTQYAELKERSGAAGDPLRGTPGTLYERSGTGHSYWYRVYYSTPGRQVEEIVAAAGDEAAVESMQSRIEFAQWASKQVSDLRKLGFQVADKSVARVLVELQHRRLFEAGLAVVGTLCYMAWLNELGVRAVAVRTQDVDLAARQRLLLAAPVSFLQTVRATQLDFVPVPGLPSHGPATSVKLPGREGLRIDLLAPGRSLGLALPFPDLEWHAQAIPHYDYLLRDLTPAAILAGGHCIAVSVPQAERVIWHKLYASTSRSGFAEKAEKDLLQAVTLAAILTEQNDALLAESFKEAPAAVRSAARKRLPAIRRTLRSHAQALEQFELCLG